MSNQQDKYINKLPFSNLFKRGLWLVCSIVLFRCFPTSYFRVWRLLVLKLFGAEVHLEANVYSSAIIESPWNLKMERNSCIGPYVRIENDEVVTIGENATVSQYCYLCTSSHDIYHISHNLITAPIFIEKNAWIAADSFIGMGVTIGEGAVVGARSSVFKSVQPWYVVGGNPVKFIKKRIIKDLY